MMRRLLGPAIVLAVLLGFGVPRAFADQGPPPSYYLALGNSLAAGYQPVGSRDDGYVPQIYRAVASTVPNFRLVNLACDGATTATLLSGGGACTYPGIDTQLAAAEKFLHSHGGKVLLITIDIGGNDVNRCAAGGTIDAACAAAAIKTVATNLGKIMERLRLAAPKVSIVGMTYYDPYLASWLTGPAGQEVARQSIVLTTQLNQKLTDAYTAPQARARVADVEGAFATTDLTTMTTLPGVGEVPLAVANICTLTWMCSRRDIHPNSTGYTVIAQAFLARLPVLSADALVG
jgi:lysophospholipase L1-like esterase